MNVAGYAAVLCAAATFFAPARLHAQTLDEASPAIRLIHQAREVAAYGRMARNPFALIVAAQMVQDSGLGRGNRRPLSPGMADQPAFAATRDLLAEAKALGRGRRAVREAADDVLARADKGRDKGPLYEIATIAGSGSDVFPGMRFEAGQRAEVYVESSRRVAVTVIDSSGRSLCRDDRNRDVAYCWWNPAGADAVRVEIVNRSDEPAVYRLITN